MDLLARGNDALNTNPPIGVDLSLSVNGSDWLWAVTAVHLLFFFIVLVPSFTSPESKRVFNYTLSIALLIGSACYYAQASDLGWDAVQQENGLTRQIFYARYINWTVSFPAIALSLGLMSGVSWTTIILNIVLSWTWVLTYLVGAYTTTAYKWGFFAFGTFAYVILAMSTLNESRESAEVLGYSRHYMILSGWVNLLWLLYPVAWGLSEGANVIGVTRGFIFFGALDVLLLPVLSVGFLVLSPGWDWAKLQLDFSEYRGVRSIDNQPTKETAPSTEDNNSTAI